MDSTSKIDSQSGFSNVNFIPGSTETTPPDALAEITLSPDEQVYELTDTMSNIEIPTQTFSTSDTDYTAPVESPGLPPPKKDLPDTPPYGKTEQKIVQDYFKTKVATTFEEAGIPMDEALFEALLSDSPLPIQDPKQAEKAKSLWKQSLEATRQAANLPENWTPQSPKAEDWTPSLAPPYDEAKQQEINQYYHQKVQEYVQEDLTLEDPPFTEEEIALLNEIINTHKINTETTPQRVIDAYMAINLAAKANTQKTFGLSTNWVVETKDADMWRPINLNIVNPQTVAKARAEEVVNNTIQMVQDLQAAAMKFFDSLASNDVRRPAAKNMVTELAKVITELQEVLQKGRTIDLEGNRNLKEYKQEVSEDRIANLDDTRAENRKMIAKQERMSKFSFVMKIVGPIISAVATIAGALLAVFTFGLSLSLVVAGVAVGMAMTAYSAVDSATGITGKAFQAFTEAIKSMMSKSPEWMQSLVKFAIIAAAVMVLAVIAVAALPAAAAAAAQTTAQIVKQIMLEVIKQLSINIMTIVITASNVVPELVANTMKAAGASEEAVRAAQITSMLLQMVLTMAVAGALGKANASEKSFTDSVKESLQGMLETVKDLANKVKDLVLSLKDGFIDTAKQMADGLLKTIQEMSKKLTELSLASLPGLNDIKGAVLSSLNQAKEAAQKLLTYLEQAAEAVGKAKDAAIENAKIAATALQEAFNNAMTNIRTLLDSFKTALTQLDPITSIQNMMTEFTKNVKALPADMYQSLKDITEGFLSLELYAKVLKLLEASAPVSRVVSSSISAAQAVELSKLLRATAELEKEQQTIQALIQLLQQMMSNIDLSSDWTQSLQTDVARLYSESNRSMMKLAQSTQTPA